MILNNYYRLLELALENGIKGQAASFVDTKGYTQLVRYHSNNASSNFIGGLGLGNLTTLSTSLTSNGMVFGTGTAEPQKSDYTLSGEIITGLVGTFSRSFSNDEDGNVVVTVIATLTNGNADAVTIGEVAYISKITGVYAESSTGNTANCMLERTLLDTPITIQAGGIGQVTYTVRFNFPT